MPATSATPMFRGSFPALITPFKGGLVDFEGFKKFVEWQIAQGSHGLVPVGTTGETPTLSHEEHKDVVRICIETARGRVPVIAGAGSNSTEEAIELTEYAKRVGAAATLHSTGYYNKPTQEGLYLHFKAINDAVDLPFIVYNVPGRAVVDISAETMARIAELKHFAGVKDATSKMERLSQHRQLIKRTFSALSGEDGSALGYNAHGGDGTISVTANIAPSECSEFQNLCMKGDFKAALALHDRLMPIHDALFCETNPAPVKYAAWRLGLIASPDCRLPMAPLSEASKKLVDAALVKSGLWQAKAAE